MRKIGSIKKQISNCQNCPLFNNQLPLLDSTVEADIIWVGLSAVKVDCTEREHPLSQETNTGKLIAEIESKARNAEFYKTNLVKCLPLKEEKIRYPKSSEMKSCSGHLKSEITGFKPKIVFLLGKQVSTFVTEDKKLKFSDTFNYKSFQKDNITYIPVHHPSYILVYKRKKLNSYINGISKIINQVTTQQLGQLASA